MSSPVTLTFFRLCIYLIGCFNQKFLAFLSKDKILLYDPRLNSSNFLKYSFLVYGLLKI